MLSTIVAALLASSAVGFVGDRLTLAWSFSPLLDNVAGYAVVSGPETCSTWTQATDVGNVTRYSFPAGAFDPSRPTCFAVQAYDSAGNRSDYSDPVLYIPPGYRPTACAQPLGRMAVGLFAGRVVGTTGSVGSRARLEFQAGSPGSPLLSLTVRVNGEAVKQSEGASLEDVGSLWFRTPVAAGTYPVTLEAENQYGCTATLATGANGKPMTITVK
jgi:hypothetical protein